MVLSITFGSARLPGILWWQTLRQYSFWKKHKKNKSYLSAIILFQSLKYKIEQEKEGCKGMFHRFSVVELCLCVCVCWQEDSTQQVESEGKWVATQWWNGVNEKLVPSDCFLRISAKKCDITSFRRARAHTNQPEMLPPPALDNNWRVQET